VAVWATFATGRGDERFCAAGGENGTPVSTST
jgi:hypothetical protein